MMRSCWPWAVLLAAGVALLLAGEHMRTIVVHKWTPAIGTTLPDVLQDTSQRRRIVLTDVAAGEVLALKPQ